MLQEIADALAQSWRNFAAAFAQFVPRLIAALIILTLGFLVAAVARWLVARLLEGLGFERLALRTGASDMLRVAEMPGAQVLVAKIVFWLVWIGFMLSGVDVLGFTALEGMVRGFAQFVPRLLVAIVILVLGVVVANFAWRATLIAAVNARVPSPRVVSGAVRALVLILAGAMALDQIAVARTIVLTAFAIAFGAVMLGLAIAFGVGGGGIARRILDHWFPEHPRSEREEFRHL